MKVLQFAIPLFLILILANSVSGLSKETKVDIDMILINGGCFQIGYTWGGENPKILTNKSNTPFVPLLFRLMF